MNHILQERMVEHFRGYNGSYCSDPVAGPVWSAGSTQGLDVSRCYTTHSNIDGKFLMVPLFDFPSAPTSLLRLLTMNS
jgi:hypothetical protein